MSETNTVSRDATGPIVREKSTRTLVAVEGISKYFPVRTGFFSPPDLLRAVDHVSLRVRKREVLGLVGESGSGKSTLGRLFLRLYEPTAGKVVFDGKDLSRITAAELRALRRRMQMIFQDPYSSLNPRMRIREIVAEGIQIHKLAKTKREETERVAALLTKVGLTPDVMDRLPHEFSGGQRQRVGIARALAVDPDFIVCDEPVSALDVSVQAQVVNLLSDLRENLGLSYLFISHDLRVVQHLCDRVAVMYLGRVVELAPRDELFEHPRHPYTDVLMNAVPSVSGQKKKLAVLLDGEPPSPLRPPPGCAFHPRCPRAIKGTCDKDVPKLEAIGPDGEHRVACHNPVP